MFDKLRSKSSDTKSDSSMDASAAAASDSSTDTRSRTASASSSKERRASASAYRTSRSASQARVSNTGYAVPPAASAQTPRANANTQSRWRDILWKNSLFDLKGTYPEGAQVRAMSQSVDKPHPEVVEERMREMYPQWRS